MKLSRFVLTSSMFLLASGLWTQENNVLLTPVSQKKAMVNERDLEIQMMKLEMGKCQLQNEKLQLEIERLRLQKGFGSSTTNPASQPNDPKKEEGKINFEASTRAEQMSKEHSDNHKMIIFDTQNKELWIEGVRYSVYELHRVMQDKKWGMKRTHVTTKANGTRRFKYSCRNISLEKYENKKYGVFAIAKGNNEQDFQLLTIEGAGFDVSEGEVRNRFQNEYFRFDGENRDKNKLYLRYKHSHGFLGWDEKLVFGFDNKTKNLMEIKYGVLDEN